MTWHGRVLDSVPYLPPLALAARESKNIERGSLSLLTRTSAIGGRRSVGQSPIKLEREAHDG
jgi:hypothetical protein